MKEFIRFLVDVILCKFIYSVKFINKEVEERLDKCLICPNHSSNLDPVWIFSRTYDLNIIAKKEIFDNKFLNKFFRYFGAFPVNRNKHDASSVLHSIHLFKNNNKQKLLIFPEGTVIHKNKKRGEAKPGAAYIALKANVPIIPVYITKNPMPFCRVNIIYGDPIFVNEKVVLNKEDLKEIDKKLLDKIYSLKEVE